MRKRSGKSARLTGKDFDRAAVNDVSVAEEPAEEAPAEAPKEETPAEAAKETEEPKTETAE